MSQLKEFFGTSIDVTDEEIILLRMMGRPFSRPPMDRTGEVPEDALVSYLKQFNSASNQQVESSPVNPFLKLEEILGNPDLAAIGTPMKSLLDACTKKDRLYFQSMLQVIVKDSGLISPQP